MLPNAFRGQEFDQALEGERQKSSQEDHVSRQCCGVEAQRRKHLVLLDWEASPKELRHETILTTPPAKLSSPRRVQDGLFEASLVLLFLASLAAVVACFVRAF